MIRRPPRSTLDRSSAASDVYKRQVHDAGELGADDLLLHCGPDRGVHWAAGGPSRPGDVHGRGDCLLYTSPSPRDRTRSRMPSSA